MAQCLHHAYFDGFSPSVQIAGYAQQKALAKRLKGDQRLVIDEGSATSATSGSPGRFARTPATTVAIARKPTSSAAVSEKGISETTVELVTGSGRIMAARPSTSRTFAMLLPMTLAMAATDRSISAVRISIHSSPDAYPEICGDWSILGLRRNQGQWPRFQHNSSQVPPDARPRDTQRNPSARSPGLSGLTRRLPE